MISKSEIQEVFKLIDNSSSIGELYDLMVIPQVNYGDAFFFISYSHLDYKKVYKDIINLQEGGISIWYDKGMVPGKDWKYVAEEFVSKFACKGIILYISPNSLKSDAIVGEIELSKKYGKPIIPIVITEKDERCDLREIVSKYTENNDVSTRIKDFFPSTIIYIDYNLEGGLKVDKIKNAMLKQELIEYRYYKNENGSDDEKSAMISKILDREIIEIDLPPLLEERVPVIGVERAAFSNFLNLKKITKTPLLYIFDYSFFRCESLSDVYLYDNAFIGNHAFYGCSSLERVHFEKNPQPFEYSYVAWQDHLATHSPIYDGNNVSRISDFAFKGCKRLGSIQIPNKFKYLGNYAFSGCTNLKRVKLSNSLEIIGECAFEGCESLEEISIPDSVKEIGARAFAKCSALKKVKFSNSVKRIEDGVFSYCENLINLDCQLDSIQEIGEYAFFGCENLSIKLNSSVIKQSNSFTGCGIVTYSRSASIDSLKESQFCRNENVEEIYVKNAIDIIPKSAFEMCKNLKKIEFFQNSVIKSIKDKAFYFCEKLERFPTEQVIEFGDYCFYRSGIHKIVINDKVKRIGEASFSGCKNLYSILVDKNNQILYSDDDVLFNKSNHSLICFPSGKKATTYRIPDNIFSIENAFEDCVFLKNIIIPKTIKRFTTYSFGRKTPLKYNLFYEGSINDFSIIVINGDIFHSLRILLSRVTFFYSERKPSKANGTDYKFWHYKNGEIEIWDI